MADAHTYTATVRWKRSDQPFLDHRYSRAHEWAFDGGVVVPGSSSPLSVRLPYSKADAVDPEEALVAALASCHMLFFLGFAAKSGICVDAYEDAAIATMDKNANGKLYLARITLKPALAISGVKRPTPDEIMALHHHAHEECYIANSILADVTVEAGPITFVDA